MADGFQVDPESLRRAAREMQAATDELHANVGQFAQQLSTVGDPWGMDMLGMLIGGGYVAIEKLALTTFDSIVDELDDFAERLGTMADNYDTTEDDNRGRLGTFDGEV